MPQSEIIIKTLGTIIAAGFGVVYAGTKIKDLFGKQKVKTTTIKLSKSGKVDDSPIAPEGFNVELLSNLCRDYNISVASVDDLRLLLERIETRTKSKIIKKFYDNSASIESMIQLWDSLEVDTISLDQRISSISDKIIPIVDIDQLVSISGLSLSSRMSATYKVQALINNSLKRANDGFRKLYGERINLLKTQFVSGINNEYLYNDIKGDLERYIKFI